MPGFSGKPCLDARGYLVGIRIGVYAKNQGEKQAVLVNAQQIFNYMLSAKMMLRSKGGFVDGARLDPFVAGQDLHLKLLDFCPRTTRNLTGGMQENSASADSRQHGEDFEDQSVGGYSDEDFECAEGAALQAEADEDFQVGARAGVSRDTQLPSPAQRGQDRGDSEGIRARRADREAWADIYDDEELFDPQPGAVGSLLLLALGIQTTHQHLLRVVQLTLCLGDDNGPHPGKVLVVGVSSTQHWPPKTKASEP